MKLRTNIEVLKQLAINFLFHRRIRCPQTSPRCDTDSGD